MVLRLNKARFPHILKSILPPADGKGKLLEMDPIIVEVPVQVLIYVGEEPQVYEGLARSEQDGSTTIILPIDASPPEGSPIQIILYENPDEPTVLEGVTTVSDEDGSIGIEIPDDLLL